MVNAKIIGCGSYLPSKVLSNKELEELIDTSDEWIRTRTGILQRHIASDAEGTAEMSFFAAKKALIDANIKPEKIDLIINATTTPDHALPSSATKLQSYLGIQNIPAFDIQAVCTGFIYGLNIADNLIKSGSYHTILLSCSEKMSRIIDWKDRNTAVLFGDGAGVVIVQENLGNGKGIIDSNIQADGSFYDHLYASNNSIGIKMEGREVFKQAIDKMTSSVEDILLKNHISIHDVNFIVPHQANIRIINGLANRLNIEPSKISTVIEKHGNCSAASIPLAFTELKSSGKLKQGDIIIFTAFGAGFTWGAAIIEW